MYSRVGIWVEIGVDFEVERRVETGGEIWG